jgi:CheY-like chemotaxis protein
MPETTVRAPRESSPSLTATVLIIDGSAASRYRLGHSLRALGCEVRQFATAEGALPVIRDQPKPSLILAAAVLPGINALDLLALLQDEPIPLSPVVVYADVGRWALQTAAKDLGARAVLPLDAMDRELPGLLTSITDPALEGESVADRVGYSQSATPPTAAEHSEPTVAPRDDHQDLSPGDVPAPGHADGWGRRLESPRALALLAGGMFLLGLIIGLAIGS